MRACCCTCWPTETTVFFRDELYFIVCGQYLDWGYVDQPAFVPLLASWSHALFGDFLPGFRLLPALALTATVALSCELARVVGGGRFSQWLAGVCVLLGPVFLLDGVLFSTDMFQALSWLALGWVLVRLEQTGDQRWWLAFGAVRLGRDRRPDCHALCDALRNRPADLCTARHESSAAGLLAEDERLPVSHWKTCALETTSVRQQLYLSAGTMSRPNASMVA